MPKKYLILKGCAGLGNRLITLCNAIAYAQRNSRILLVDWTDGQFAERGKNAFYEYFELKNVEHICSYDEIEDLSLLSFYPALWKEHLHEGLYDLYIQEHSGVLNSIPKKLVPKGKWRKIYGFWEPITIRQKALNTDMHALRSVFNSENIPLGGHYADQINEDVIFYADFMPTYDANILRENIVLKADLQHELDNAQEKLIKGNQTIGVHIRATDKKPTRIMQDLINQLKSTSANSTVFLATDNRKVEDVFRKELTNTVTLHKFLPEEQKEGLHQWALYNQKSGEAQNIFKDSILDMWLLSKCNVLFYQGNSSFSRISKELKNDTYCFDWQTLAA